MGGPTSQFTNQRISLPINTKEFLGENTTIQKDHVKDKDQLDRAQTQSSLPIRPTRRKKPNTGIKIMDRHRDKCRFLSIGRHTI